MYVVNTVRKNLIIRRGLITSFASHSPSVTNICHKQRISSIPVASFSANTENKDTKPYSKAKSASVNLFNVDNNTLPLPDCEPDCIEIDGIRQYKNPHTSNIPIPNVSINNQAREKYTKRAQASQNPILLALQSTLRASEVSGERYLLTNLPHTPRPNPLPQYLYEFDTPDVALPAPVSPDVGSNGKPTINILTQVKHDIAEIEEAKNMYSGLLKSAQIHRFARSASQRCLMFVDERVKNPKLYKAFGLEDCFSSRQAMAVLHVWFYARGVTHRPSITTSAYLESLFHDFDMMLQQNVKEHVKRSKRVEAILDKVLPATRGTMTVLDKAVYSLVGGDCDPMNGALYRTLFRYSEESKFADSLGLANAILNRLPDYTPSLDVYMDKPTDLAYINNLTQYIVNNLYAAANACPRDFYTHMSGFSDFVDIPEPPKVMLGPLTKLEMERYSYPIYNQAPSRNTLQRMFGFSKDVAQTEALLLQPKIEGAAHRPPSFAYTYTHQLANK